MFTSQHCNWPSSCTLARTFLAVCSSSIDQRFYSFHDCIGLVLFNGKEGWFYCKIDEKIELKRCASVKPFISFTKHLDNLKRKCNVVSRSSTQDPWNALKRTHFVKINLKFIRKLFEHAGSSFIIIISRFCVCHQLFCFCVVFQSKYKKMSNYSILFRLITKH